MPWSLPLETAYPPFEQRPSRRTRLTVIGMLLRLVYDRVGDWRDPQILARLKDTPRKR